MNYSLAYKLRDVGLPDNLNPKFYEVLENNYKEFKTYDELNGKTYQIQDNTFNNMHMLENNIGYIMK